MKKLTLLILTVILFAVIPAQAGPFFDVETGPVFTGINDVRIPGKSGTRFSFVDDLNTDPWYFLRFKFGYIIKDQHSLYFLAAPLEIPTEGKLKKNVNFKGRVFNAGDTVTAKFKFNSYRFTYRYDPVFRDDIEFGIGLTFKIRDAAISMEDNGLTTTRNDLGFVPLITIRLQWKFVPMVSFLLDADWLAAPQGRAEDILAAFQYHVNKNITVKLGYRILEGGADNSKVYTFSLFHYLVFGATFVI